MGRGGGGSERGSFSLTPQRLPYPQTTLSGGLSPMRFHHHCFITNPTGSEVPALPVSPFPLTARCRATRRVLTAVAQPTPRVRTRQKRSREGNGFAQGHTGSMWSSRRWAHAPQSLSGPIHSAAPSPTSAAPAPAPGDRGGQDEKQLWLRACPAVEVSCGLAAVAELAGTICSHPAGMRTGQAWWLNSSASQAPGTE